MSEVQGTGMAAGSVVEQIPDRWRELFVSTLTERAPEVLEALRSTTSPTHAEAQSAKRALMQEFVQHVDEDSEPTATGRELDNLVEFFINRFTLA